jgi:hypothetical protein
MGSGWSGIEEKSEKGSEGKGEGKGRGESELRRGRE